MNRRIKMADLSDEQKRQLKKCYEVIRKYQEEDAFLEKEDCATALVGHRAAIWFNSDFLNSPNLKLSNTFSLMLSLFACQMLETTIAKTVLIPYAVCIFSL